VRANCSRRSWRGRGLGCGERRGHAEHGLHRQAGRRLDGGLWAVSRGLWDRGRGRRGGLSRSSLSGRGARQARSRRLGANCSRRSRRDRRRGEPHHRSLGDLVAGGLQRDRSRRRCGGCRWNRRRRRNVRGGREAVDGLGLVGERLAARDAEGGKVRILRAAEGAEAHRRSPLRMRVWTLARAIRRRQSSQQPETKYQEPTTASAVPVRAVAHRGSAERPQGREAEQRGTGFDGEEV
jgi:hypothetical protein